MENGHDDCVTRRDALRSVGVVAGAAADLHIEPDLQAGEGVAACVRHVQSRTEKPELILIGGDCVMDSFEADETRTKTQWDLSASVFKNDCSLPIEACLGNHDIWGQNKAKSGTTGKEPGWGKKRAMDYLHLKRPYHSFDKAGWHFVCLDSVMPQGDGYIGQLDGQQWDWFQEDLKNTPAAMPVLVMTHIPIMTPTVFMDGKEDVSAERKVSGSRMMTDSKKFVKLFETHSNVKVCVSGHVHELDRLDYQGLTYLCEGRCAGTGGRGGTRCAMRGTRCWTCLMMGALRGRTRPMGGTRGRTEVASRMTSAEPETPRWCGSSGLFGVSAG